MPAEVVHRSDAECDEGSSRERAIGIGVHLAAGTSQGATERLVTEPVVQREHEGHGRRVVELTGATQRAGAPAAGRTKSTRSVMTAGAFVSCT